MAAGRGCDRLEWSSVKANCKEINMSTSIEPSGTSQFDGAAYAKLVQGAKAASSAEQVLRRALVPLGHLSGRLPVGNPGRATVSAFEPLTVRPELAELIANARK